MPHPISKFINEPPVGLDLVDNADVDEYVLEPSGYPGTLLNGLIVKNAYETSATLDLRTTHLLDSTWLALTTLMGMP